MSQPLNAHRNVTNIQNAPTRSNPSLPGMRAGDDEHQRGYASGQDARRGNCPGKTRARWKLEPPLPIHPAAERMRQSRAEHAVDDDNAEDDLPSHGRECDVEPERVEDEAAPSRRLTDPVEAAGRPCRLAGRILHLN